MDCFIFRRRWISPESHKWQCLQSAPFWHPEAFQNQAHGRQAPVPCSCEPSLGYSSSIGSGRFSPSVPTANSTFTGSADQPASGLCWLASDISCSDPTAVVWDSSSDKLPFFGVLQREALAGRVTCAFGEMIPSAIMEDSASSLAEDTFGVARPSRITVCLARFRALISPSGHK